MYMQIQFHKGLHGKLSSSVTQIFLIKLFILYFLLLLYVSRISSGPTAKTKKHCTLKEVHFPFYPCSCITYKYFSLLGDERTTLICPRISQSLDHKRSFWGGRLLAINFYRISHSEIQSQPEKFRAGKKWNWDMVEFIAQKIPFYYLIWKVQSS